MALNIPSPAGRQNLRTPDLPPLVHSRSGNELYDRPLTPTHTGFMSPTHTPQGSPSKNRMPPGALDLPNVFDNAMKLAPPSSTKAPYNTSAYSPGKGGALADDLGFYNEGAMHQDNSVVGSPTRRSNKENVPSRLLKDFGPPPAQAAISRQEPYQTKERIERPKPQIRGLTPEELEKLQLPNVKRLANVTQLCQFNCVLSPKITRK